MNLRQIYSINLSMAAYVVGDVLVKILGQVYPPVELIFWRSCVIACAFGLYLAVNRKLFAKNVLKPAVFLRCVFDSINSISFVIALVHIELADIYSVLLTTPFLMTILAVVLLKEPVGWRRWLAIVGGLAGSLLIIKPSAHGFNYWAAVAFLAALSGALRDYVTVKIHATISTVEVTLMGAIFTATAAGAAFLFGIGQAWKAIAINDAYFVLAMAAASLTGTVLLIQSCRIGPLYIAAAFRFMLLVWGGVAGYVVFGNVPDAWSLTGAVIIVMCALYVLYREVIRHQTIASAVPSGGTTA
jgi:drug/metabolite transporter (DMT)-like permease